MRTIEEVKRDAKEISRRKLFHIGKCPIEELLAIIEYYDALYREDSCWDEIRNLKNLGIEP